MHIRLRPTAFAPYLLPTAWYILRRRSPSILYLQLCLHRHLDQLYSLAQRMKHAGQKDPDTCNNHYQPNNSGADGQGSYFGTKVRTVANDLFRGLTVAQNPQLVQSLPAAEREALKSSPEFAAIEEELTALLGQRDKISFPPHKALCGETKAGRQRTPKMAEGSAIPAQITTRHAITGASSTV